MGCCASAKRDELGPSAAETSSRLPPPDYVVSNPNFKQHWRKAPDGAEIYTVLFESTVQPARGIYVHHHGLTDHAHASDKDTDDDTMWEPLLQSGYHVYTYDARGHGRTGVANGDIGRVTVDKLWVEDLCAAIDGARSAHPSLPLYLGAHSLGAGVVCKFVADMHASEQMACVSGLVLLAPFSDPGFAQRGAFKVLRTVAPKMRLSGVIGTLGILADHKLSKDVGDVATASGRQLTRENVEELLKKYNKDGDGYLDKEELTACLNGPALNLKLSSADIDACMKEMDANGDGKVSIDEFVTTALCPGDSLRTQFMSCLNANFFESAGTYIGPTACSKHVAPLIKVPVLLIHGLHDGVNPYRPAKEFVLAMPGEKTIPAMPAGLRHLLFSDSEKDIVWSALTGWLRGEGRGVIEQ
jgi:alpha-beta hydrolase superfamily lysophospholipase